MRPPTLRDRQRQPAGQEFSWRAQRSCKPATFLSHLQLWARQRELDLRDGISADHSATDYVSSSCTNRVQKFDGSGAYVGQWGTFGTGNANSTSPRVAADMAGTCTSRTSQQPGSEIRLVRYVTRSSGAPRGAARQSRTKRNRGGRVQLVYVVDRGKTGAEFGGGGTVLSPSVNDRKRHTPVPYPGRHRRGRRRQRLRHRHG